MNRNRELPKGYSPDAMEEKWYAAWMQRGLFDAEVDPSRPAFSIVIPLGAYHDSVINTEPTSFHRQVLSVG